MDRSFEVATAVTWSDMVINDFSFSMRAEAEKGTQTMST
jgi:hypothetical protein